MTNNPAQQMRQLIEAVDTPQALEEARPFGFLKQLGLAATQPFNPSAQMQLSVNAYANNIYTAWRTQSAVLKQSTDQEPTAEDFVTWYSSSPREPGRASPITVGILRRYMRDLGIPLDQPIPDAKLTELCKKIGGAVAQQIAKVSLKLVRGATPAEEQQILDWMAQLDDVLIRMEPNLSLRLVARFLVQLIGKENKTAMFTAWNRYKNINRTTALSGFGPNEFNSDNAAKLDHNQKTQLVDALPDILLLTLKEINKRKALGATVKDKTQTKTAPQTKLNPTDYAASYAKWQTALQPLGFSADEIKRIVDREIFGTPTA